MLPIVHLAAYVQLARARNCVAAGLTTLVGAHLGSGRPFPATRATLAALVVALLVAAANMYNDLHDIEEDRTNAPDRPLPSGALTTHEVRLATAATAMGALALASMIGICTLAAATIMLALAAIYSLALKSTVLFGNILVGALSGSSIVLGSLAAGSVTPEALRASVLIALFVLFREILKTAADHDGDRKAAITTIATRFGQDAAIDAARAIALVFVIASLAAGAGVRASSAFPWVVAIALVAPTLGVVAALRVNRGTSRLRATLRVTKWLWFVAVVPLVLLRIR